MVGWFSRLYIDVPASLKESTKVPIGNIRGLLASLSYDCDSRVCVELSTKTRRMISWLQRVILNRAPFLSLTNGKHMKPVLTCPTKYHLILVMLICTEKRRLKKSAPQLNLKYLQVFFLNYILQFSDFHLIFQLNCFLVKAERSFKIP